MKFGCNVIFFEFPTLHRSVMVGVYCVRGYLEAEGAVLCDLLNVEAFKALSPGHWVPVWRKRPNAVGIVAEIAHHSLCHDERGRLQQHLKME